MHPAVCVARLAGGYPLYDSVRPPGWAASACCLTELATVGECAVVSCSALTRAYRDVLRGVGSDVLMVHLAGPYDLVALRLAARRGHFMPPQLLASQYAVLEPLAHDEPGITLRLDTTPEHIADEVLRTFPLPPHSAG